MTTQEKADRKQALVEIEEHIFPLRQLSQQLELLLPKGSLRYCAIRGLCETAANAIFTAHALLIGEKTK